MDDTGSIAGIDPEIEIDLVLSGVNILADLESFANRPRCILGGVGHTVP